MSNPLCAPLVLPRHRILATGFCNDCGHRQAIYFSQEGQSTTHRLSRLRVDTPVGTEAVQSRLATVQLKEYVVTARKTIAIFGAGPGLGASIARRFGREGYRVALIARRVASLEERVAELAGVGIEAAAFSFDLSGSEGIPALIHSIEERFEVIDVAVYAPAPPNPGFVPAAELGAAQLHSSADIFLYSPIEVSRALLPGFLERGDGAIMIVGGLSAVVPTPGFSAVGPLMSAARNYVLTLSAEVKSRGVYAGSLSIGAVIDRSAGKQSLEANGIRLDESFPIIDPDDIAQDIWSIITHRDRSEVILPPMRAA
jgi:NADP-dependent 3-hydroxy acid dehydrogenase YdfG